MSAVLCLASKFVCVRVCVCVSVGGCGIVCGHFTLPCMCDSVYYHSIYLQDRELTRWVHEAFLQSLDYSLLPVYLDVLQVLRSKVHSPLYIMYFVTANLDL